MDRVLTETQGNIISAALASHRTHLAQLAGQFLTNGNDAAVQEVLAQVKDVDDLTALVARDDALIFVGYDA